GRIHYFIDCDYRRPVLPKRSCGGDIPRRIDSHRCSCGPRDWRQRLLRLTHLDGFDALRGRNGPYARSEPREGREDGVRRICGNGTVPTRTNDRDKVTATKKHKIHKIL